MKRLIKDIEKECEGIPNQIEVFMKKREKYCSAKVKTLIFNQYLIDIQNQKAGLQTITGMFGKITLLATPGK